MTILFTDGFDHYNTAQLNTKWDYAAGLVSQPQIGTGGRRSSRCLQLLNNYTRVGKYLPSRKTLFMGFAYNPSNGQPYEAPLVSCWHDGVRLASVHVSITGRLFVMASKLTDGVLVYQEVGSSNLYPVRSGMYTYIEFGLYVDGNNGTVAVMVEEDAAIGESGLDTAGKYAGNGFEAGGATMMMLGGGNHWPDEYWNGPLKFDDVYICDDANSENSFLGDVTIEEQLPIGDGLYKEFTPSSGNDHFEMVNDAWNGVDGIASYVGSNNNGARDTYRFPNLSANNGTVVQVGMTYYAEKTESGVRKLKALTDGNLQGSEVSILQEFGFHQSFFSGNWSIADVNNNNFGQIITE